MAENMKNTALGIVVDDGFQRVPITNKYGDEVGVFYFNPTDIGIVERYNRLAEKFDSITEPLQDVDANDESSEIKGLDEAKERLFEAVNELFGGNAAEAFFGKVHPFSPIDGKFYCETVLAAVGQFIGEQFEAETKKMSARVEKYTNRATRRAKK